MVDAIYSAYITFPKAMNNFVSKYPLEKRVQAEVLFYNAHYKAMQVLSKEQVLRMPFYVFTNEFVKNIELQSKSLLTGIDNIDAFAERLFLSKQSKWDIDQYFNLYFAPMDGLFNTNQGVNSYRFAAQVFNINDALISDIAKKVDNLSLQDYATFWAIVVSMIKTLNPQGYTDGINRFIDKINGILVNPENFKSSDKVIDSYMANEQIIINALKLPIDNIVFQNEYIKNMDLLLYTRMLVEDNVEIIPHTQHRLDLSDAILTWRHNARIRLKDITGELKKYKSIPESESTWDKIKEVVAVIAIILIAPYAISAVTPLVQAAAAKASALFVVAKAKAGELALAATGKAVDEAVSEVKNNLLEQDKNKIQVQTSQVQAQVSTQKASDFKLSVPMVLTAISLLTFLSR